jgi:hypothetical protein
MQKIQYLAVSELSFHPDNPRTISKYQFKTLCDSIQKNPDWFEANPILCNKGLVVFSGNQRLRAALELGLEKVPVAVMDISEARQKEIMIRANVSNGEWNFDELANLFDEVELKDWGVDIPTHELNDNEDDKLTLASEKKKHKCPNCGEEF